jgi:hypothetical protein
MAGIVQHLDMAVWHRKCSFIDRICGLDNLIISLMLTEKKKQLMAVVDNARADGKIIDEVPVPFYSPHTDSCIFHFRSQGQFVQAAAIRCDREEMQQLHSYIQEALPPARP